MLRVEIEREQARKDGAERGTEDGARAEVEAVTECGTKDGSRDETKDGAERGRRAGKEGVAEVLYKKLRCRASGFGNAVLVKFVRIPPCLLCGRRRLGAHRKRWRQHHFGEAEKH